jgi:DNA-binding Lrp family transcriptional regulator
MISALLLINTQIGSEKEVLKTLKLIDSLKEIYLVYGVYDIVTKIEAKNMDELKEIITCRLLRSKLVKNSTTMLIIPDKQKYKANTNQLEPIIV